MNRSLIAAAVAAFGFCVHATEAPSSQRALLDRYCISCHNQKAKTGGLTLEQLDVDHPAAHAETWEKVVRKVRAGMMPPAGMPRPDRSALSAFAAKLEEDLDKAAVGRSNP